MVRTSSIIMPRFRMVGIVGRAPAVHEKVRSLPAGLREAQPCRFLPRDAMHKRGLCCHPVSVCPSVRHVRELRQNE